MPDITLALVGKTIDSVYQNKAVIAIHCTDGTEVQIGWRDEKGNPVTGEPFLYKVCRHIYARTAKMKALGRLNLDLRR